MTQDPRAKVLTPEWNDEHAVKSERKETEMNERV